MTGRRADGRREAGFLESVFAVLALVFILNTVRALISGTGGDDPNGDRTAGNLVFQLLALAIYGAGIFALIRRCPVWLPTVMVRGWPLLALAGLALLSFVWSDYPAASLRRAIALAFTFAFALYMAVRFSPQRLIDLLAIAFLVYVLAGFTAAAVPGVGIHSDVHSGSWRGFAGHKNELGRLAALIAAAAVLLRHHGRLMPRLALPLVAGSLVLLVMSGSKTPLVTLIVCLILVPVLRALFSERHGRYAIAASLRLTMAVVLMGAGIAMVGLVVPPVLELLGKDITLTGRTKLWAYAVELGLERPWFGAGYRAFWTDANTLYFSEFFYWGGEARDGFKGPGNGHNGYLDVWLELGTTGFIIWIIVMVSTLSACARLARRGRIAELNFLLLMFVFVAFYSITEKVILQQTEGVWFLFMVAYLMSWTPNPAPRQVIIEPPMPRLRRARVILFSGEMR